MRAYVCASVRAAKGRGLSVRARGGREQCDGSGCLCAEGSSPRVCAGERGVGARLSEAVAACGGARRGTAAPGFALLRASALSAARGARSGVRRLPPPVGACAELPLEGKPRGENGESGGAQRSGAAATPAAEVGKVPGSPRSAAGRISLRG